MAEQPRGSAYLGPEKGRWIPAAWADVIEAAAGGLLDESHWVDLKQELPAGKATFNTDLAKDLASLAVDGGLLVIGVEDHDSRAGKVRGVELGKLADRVDQVARGKVRPPLVVRSHEIPDPNRAGWGCLLVHVPPSAQAPHMVDYVYYGRGDRANMKLGNEQVRAILDARARGHADVAAELQRMVDDDPMPVDQRQLGHYYFLAQPEIGVEGGLVDLLTGPDAGGIVHELLAQIVRDRGGPAFGPDILHASQRVRRAEGLAFISYDPGDGPRNESHLVELLIREDGGIRLTCGRGTDVHGSSVFPASVKQQAVIPLMVLGLTYAGIALAGRLSDQYGAYQGQWRVGIRMDGLRGVVPLDRLAQGSFGPGNPYSRDEYEYVVSATTEELVDTPQAVTERIVERLFRGLGISARYLPYRPGRRQA